MPPDVVQAVHHVGVRVERPRRAGHAGVAEVRFEEAVPRCGRIELAHRDDAVHRHEEDQQLGGHHRHQGCRHEPPGTMPGHGRGKDPRRRRPGHQRNGELPGRPSPPADARGLAHVVEEEAARPQQDGDGRNGDHAEGDQEAAAKGRSVFHSRQPSLPRVRAEAGQHGQAEVDDHLVGSAPARPNTTATVTRTISHRATAALRTGPSRSPGTRRDGRASAQPASTNTATPA